LILAAYKGSFMSLRIRTNTQSLVAQRWMTQSTSNVGKITERLSSGYRINKGADDAAGFAISEVLRSDVRSLTQAKRNANDGVSLVEVAEGGLHEINNIMIRLRELSVQSASDTIGTRERQYLQQEFTALKDEVDRIAIGTEFNGTRLLVGKAEISPELRERHNNSPLEIQVGKDFYLQNDSLEAKNPINIIRLDFSTMNAFTDGEGGLGIGNSQNEEGSRVDTKQTAQMSINKIDGAMQKIASYRASLGSIQNRLETTDRSIGIQIENLGAAKSRIKDTDFASETAKLTQQTILQQAGASVLAQANQAPQIALKLLQ
jgi:flagellin